jgi:hypothetical protein
MGFGHGCQSKRQQVRFCLLVCIGEKIRINMLDLSWAIHQVWSQPQVGAFLGPQLQFSSCLCNAPITEQVSREGTKGGLCWRGPLMGLSGNKCRKLVPLIMAASYVAAQERHPPAAHK